MIPAPRGLVARYEQSPLGTETRPFYDARVIVAFDDEGYPLLVGDSSRYLVRADTYRNYAGIGHDPFSEVVALMPAGGWRIEYTFDDGKTASQPLVGWGLKLDGDVVPLDTDSDGAVTPTSELGGKWRIYHPDQVGFGTERPTETELE